MRRPFRAAPGAPRLRQERLLHHRHLEAQHPALPFRPSPCRQCDRSRLRLEDVLGLETEDVYIESKLKARQNLRENGATPEEIDFLLEKRVELNAFASDELIQWLEIKLAHHGVAKVVPRDDVLAEAWRRMRKQALVQKRIDAFLKDLDGEKAESVPLISPPASRSV